MWTLTVQPRFNETDALGHINNTTLPVWFEQARTPIFRYFTPDLDPQNWHLIIAKIDVEFLAELYLQHEVEVRTYFSKIGNSSMTIVHEAWQQGKLCAKGHTVMVHFDHDNKGSKPIPDDIKAQLLPHLVEQ